jgi:hypothetical protein
VAANVAVGAGVSVGTGVSVGASVAAGLVDTSVLVGAGSGTGFVAHEVTDSVKTSSVPKQTSLFMPLPPMHSAAILFGVTGCIRCAQLQY